MSSTKRIFPNNVCYIKCVQLSDDDGVAGRHCIAYRSLESSLSLNLRLHPVVLTSLSTTVESPIISLCP